MSKALLLLNFEWVLPNQLQHLSSHEMNGLLLNFLLKKNLSVGFCHELREENPPSDTELPNTVLCSFFSSNSLGWLSVICMQQSVWTSCRTSMWSIQSPYSWYCRGYYLHRGPPCYFASPKSDRDVLHVWRWAWLWQLLHLLCCASYRAYLLYQEAFFGNRARSHGVRRGINCNEPHHSGLVVSELLESHIYCHGRDVLRNLHIVLFI